jgi:hypothetical protein
MRDILIFEKLGFQVRNVFKVQVAEMDDPCFRRSIQHREGFRDFEIERAFAPGMRIGNCVNKVWYKVDLFIEDFACTQSAFVESMQELGKVLPVEPEDGTQLLVGKDLHTIIRLNGMNEFFAYIGFHYSKRQYDFNSEVLKHERLKQEKNNGDNH